MRRLIAAGLVPLAALTGCVSAQTTGSAPASLRPSTSLQCDLYSPATLEALFGKPFSQAVLDPQSSETDVRCQWAAKDQEALVLTKVTTGNAKTVYANAKQTAAQTLGPVTGVRVPGTKAAFMVVPQRRTTMLVGGQVVDVTVLANPVSGRDLLRAAALAARNAA